MKNHESYFILKLFDTVLIREQNEILKLRIWDTHQ